MNTRTIVDYTVNLHFFTYPAFFALSAKDQLESLSDKRELTVFVKFNQRKSSFTYVSLSD